LSFETCGRLCVLVRPRSRFYLTKSHREDLLRRTHYLDVVDADLETAPIGSLLMF
jgi:hypothetical protein